MQEIHISMEEPKVITIDDVIDSSVMHINDLPRHFISMEERILPRQFEY